MSSSHNPHHAVAAIGSMHVACAPSGNATSSRRTRAMDDIWSAGAQATCCRRLVREGVGARSAYSVAHDVVPMFVFVFARSILGAGLSPEIGLCLFCVCFVFVLNCFVFVRICCQFSILFVCVLCLHFACVFVAFYVVCFIDFGCIRIFCFCVLYISLINLILYVLHSGPEKRALRALSTGEGNLSLLRR